jgi:DNA-directed RNA polymerase specialized sigma24 family protein
VKSEIAKLFQCIKFDWYCKKLTKGNKIYEDLKSHVILILLESEPDKIKNIEAFAKRTAYFEYINKHSLFNKQLGKENDILGTNIEAEQDEDIDNKHYITVNIIEKNLIKDIKTTSFPVEHYFFQAYLKCKTIRATAKELNISRSTVHRIVTSYKKRINEDINRIGVY